MMNEAVQCVTTTGALLLVLWAVVLSAYWTEMKDWSARLRAVQLNTSTEKEEPISKSLAQYKGMFRAASTAAFATLVVTALPLYVPSAADLCRWLLLFPFAALALMYSIYLGGKWPL